jgi:hypothetical protein
MLRPEYGRDFVRFCEKQMRLGEVTGFPVPLGGALTSPSRLGRLLLEFADQWPRHAGELQTRIDSACLGGQSRGWLIYPLNEYPNAPAPGAREEVPAGIILVTPAAGRSNPPTYDFLIWMRGAYRNSGLGRSAARDVLRDLDAGWPAGYCLRVTLPVDGLTGPGGKLQKGMWLTFFYHLGFVRSGLAASVDEDEEREIILERRSP